MAVRREITSDFDADYDEHAVVSTGREQEAAGVKAVMVSLKRGLESMGVVSDRGVVGPAEPAQGFRLPGLRVARGARRPQVRRVLRERRQGRRRGGDQARRHPGVLRAAFSRRTRRQARVLAFAAGPAHSPDGASARRWPLPAHRLAGRVPADRRRTAGAGRPRTRRCSTHRGAPATRPRSSTS